MGLSYGRACVRLFAKPPIRRTPGLSHHDMTSSNQPISGLPGAHPRELHFIEVHSLTSQSKIAIFSNDGYESLTGVVNHKSLRLNISND